MTWQYRNDNTGLGYLSKPAAYATIGDSMARGWESKSVEEQIELASEKAASLKTQTKASEEDAAKRRELESLQLSRTRVIQDMASASNPRYREQLQRSLDFLDEKLARAAGSGQ